MPDPFEFAGPQPTEYEVEEVFEEIKDSFDLGDDKNSFLSQLSAENEPKPLNPEKYQTVNLTPPKEKMIFFCSCGAHSKYYCTNASQWINQCFKVFDQDVMKSDYDNLLMSVKNLEEKYQGSFKQI